MKYSVLLPQPYLRKHILNFEKGLRDFVFVKKRIPKSQASFYLKLPTYAEEIRRIKTGKIVWLRRILGIPNVRLESGKGHDLLFTYGCVLFSRKPYCVYVENGLALYNYDLQIAKHPLARAIVTYALRQKNCKKIIFMSKAAEKSFYSSVPYSQKTQEILRGKSVQIYPFLETGQGQVKHFSGTLRLLFSGMFYMKGGTEVLAAFQRIRKLHPVELTIIAPLQTISSEDIQKMKSIDGLTLLDATLEAEEMNTLYRTHDVFLLPTFRDSYGLVLQEAASWGMPLICTDQFATAEIAIDGCNGFVLKHHPLKDYDTETFRFLGKYYNPKSFYTDLFKAQKSGRLWHVEQFIETSLRKYFDDPELLETHSRNALQITKEKFSQEVISRKIERVFCESV